jgi:NitT/TauT family transport system ATP-binding protein
MSGEPIAVVEDVTKSFDGVSGPVVALEGASLTCAPGEFVALLGPSGCGKTTLLNLVAGLDTPDSGRIEVRGSEAAAGTVPCVFQHYTLFPWRSISGNVVFGLEMRGTSRRERTAAAGRLLAQVGLAGFEHSFPHELSGGMRQRAAMAQALILDPALLLMDEPFGALDDAARREMGDLLTRIWSERRMTVLFVTHNIDEALALGDRVVVFKERPGKPVAEFRVDLPRPRDRLGSEFTALYVEIRRLLSGART